MLRGGRFPLGRTGNAASREGLLVLVSTPDEVLDVQDGGGQVLLQALLWGYRQE